MDETLHPVDQAPAAGEVVERFLLAIEQGDFPAARAQLSDRGFQYRGPVAEFDDADSFIDDIARVGVILKRIETRRVFVDGDEVLVIHDFHSTLSEIARTRIAAWFRIDAGRITYLEVFFDARAYAGLFVG